MAPYEYTVKFRSEDWKTPAYPVRVRIANIREQCAMNAAQGLPPPDDAVVRLDKLSAERDLAWNEGHVMSVLLSESVAFIKKTTAALEKIVVGKRPIHDPASSSKVNFLVALEEWKRNAFFLITFYAASIFHEQLEINKAARHTAEHVVNERSSLSWERKAKEAGLEKLKEEQKARNAAEQEFESESEEAAQAFTDYVRQTIKMRRDAANIATGVGADVFSGPLPQSVPAAMNEAATSAADEGATDCGRPQRTKKQPMNLRDPVLPSASTSAGVVIERQPILNTAMERGTGVAYDGGSQAGSEQKKKFTLKLSASQTKRKRSDVEEEELETSGEAAMNMRPAKQVRRSQRHQSGDHAADL